MQVATFRVHEHVHGSPKGQAKLKWKAPGYYGVPCKSKPYKTKHVNNHMISTRYYIYIHTYRTYKYCILNKNNHLKSWLKKNISSKHIKTLDSIPSQKKQKNISFLSKQDPTWENLWAPDPNGHDAEQLLSPLQLLTEEDGAEAGTDHDAPAAFHGRDQDRAD